MRMEALYKSIQIRFLIADCSWHSVLVKEKTWTRDTASSFKTRAFVLLFYFAIFQVASISVIF